ncbi:MAG: hypothetical protein ACREDR_47280 [Blastocatellia bacterium]
MTWAILIGVIFVRAQSNSSRNAAGTGTRPHFGPPETRLVVAPARARRTARLLNLHSPRQRHFFSAVPTFGAAAEIPKPHSPECRRRWNRIMMLQISRVHEPPACTLCRDSGIIPTREGPISLLMEEAGVFCTCNVGIERWQSMLERISD